MPSPQVTSTNLPTISSCGHERSIVLTFKFDKDNVKANQQGKYLGLKAT